MKNPYVTGTTYDGTRNASGVEFRPFTLREMSYILGEILENSTGGE